MTQLRDALESSSTSEVEGRVSEVKDAMLPTFLALPRSAQDHLDASATRYILHRYFIDRDGWFVQGWEGSGEEAGNSLPNTILHDDPLANVLSSRLAERGLSLREVA